MVTICEEEINLRIPNVFTPNGDGENDFLTIIALSQINEIEVNIYNRWGKKVFETDQLNNFWDGKTISGIDATEGTYFYTIGVIDLLDKTKIFNGSFTLFR